MLASSPVYPSLPATDLQRSRRFYEDVLGFGEAVFEREEAVLYRAGRDTMLLLYQRPPSPAEHTLAFFTVADIERAMAELRARGVTFEEYDTAALKTEDGVYTDPGGFRAAWFKDPDGNILGLTQLAAA